MNGTELVLKTRFRELLELKYGGEENIPPQMELADQIGIAQSTVGNWLRNRVEGFRSETVERICKFLDCEVGDLLYLEEVA